MSDNCKDILVSCAIVAAVASVVAYKTAELVYTIAGLQQQITEQDTNETRVLGFTAPSEESGDDEENHG